MNELLVYPLDNETPLDYSLLVTSITVFRPQVRRVVRLFILLEIQQRVQFYPFKSEKSALPRVPSLKFVSGGG